MTFFRIAAAVWAAMGALALIVAAPAPAQTPQAGGHLNVMLREDLPQGFAVHETSTISTSFPSLPCFSNLVLFDQLKRVESPETLVGELAEKWSWQDGYRNLVFFLRKDVKWHDGKPFTSKDVKFTFDMLREAPEAQGQLDVSFPGETTKTAAEQLKKAVPQLVVTPVGQMVNDNIIMNVKKAPFDN